MKAKFILWLFTTSLSFLVKAQVQLSSLIASPVDKLSYPKNFFKFNDIFLFDATDSAFGRELWISDGTEENTRLLKDINPGPYDGIEASLENSYIVLNNIIYFLAKDRQHGEQIWRTDGTAEGTVKITDFLDGNIFQLTLVGDQIYFTIGKNDSLQIWKSDGTAAGTIKIKGNLPYWGEPTFQGACNNIFIFTFRGQETNNSRVWRSDGTEGGTFPLTDELDWIATYIKFNNKVYFIARSIPLFGFPQLRGLIATDGTVENTKPIKAIDDGQDYIDFADAIEVNGKMYFLLFMSKMRYSTIWESDGTASNTFNIYEDTGIQRHFMTSNLESTDSSLIFCSRNLMGGTSLMSLKLAGRSVTEIKEVKDSTIDPFIYIENVHAIFLTQTTPGNFFLSVPQAGISGVREFNRSGWYSDLTTENTRNIPILNGVWKVLPFQDKIFFSKASTNINESFELWSSDLSSDNTQLLKNINQSKYGLDNVRIIPYKNHLLFNADDGSRGRELWSYNNEALNVTLVKDIATSGITTHALYFPPEFISYKEKVYFPAYNAQAGYEIWQTDATENGTTLVNDFMPDDTWNPQFLTLHNNEIFFTAFLNGTFHLCKTDGSQMAAVKDIGKNEFGINLEVTQVVSSGDFLFFKVESAGQDLWVSDGTSVGTYKLQDFIYLDNLMDVNGTLYFSASSVYPYDIELYKSNGTLETTLLVKEIGVGYSSNPQHLFNYNGTLYFSAFTYEHGRELWTSDGTDVGTIQVVDLNQGVGNGLITPSFSILHDTLYFAADDKIHGVELWRTDGSPNGTSLVKDINPGLESSFPDLMKTVNDNLFFHAYLPYTGIELWRSEGTDISTHLVSDILPDIESSFPTNISNIENDIFFIAETRAAGRQLWKIANGVVSTSRVKNEENSFIVFPNPTAEYVYYASKININRIDIYDVNGKHIRSLANAPTIAKIYIGDLPQGTYFAHFKVNGNDVIVKRIIKI